MRWTSVISPNASIYFNALSAVAASSSSDVWAVGSYDDGSLTRTLIEHSNGRLWKIVAREGGFQWHTRAQHTGAGHARVQHWPLP